MISCAGIALRGGVRERMFRPSLWALRVTQQSEEELGSRPVQQNLCLQGFKFKILI